MVHTCLCGGEPRIICPRCRRLVRVVAGKIAGHEVAHCTGSHMEYKQCPQAGKLAGVAVIVDRP